MSKKKPPKDFLARLRMVTAKRPKTVIDHILKHGHITTEDLQETYGYEHPPRAARDVREQGIPLETFKVRNKEGRAVAAYRFPQNPQVNPSKLGGRKAFSKKDKEQLTKALGSRCSICLDAFDERSLQIDHRIPYEVAGEKLVLKPQNNQHHMLLCPSCNRAKSWSCEHCENWIGSKSSRICGLCYWASPEKYCHVALQQIRRLDITWVGNEVAAYEEITKLANNEKTPLPSFVKKILSRQIKKDWKCRSFPRSI